MPISRATSSSAPGSAPSTTSTSTASRPFPTCSRRSARGSPPRGASWGPTLGLPRGPRAARLAAAVAELEPDSVRLAGPELGAVALAAAASLSSRLPFLIVRGEAKGYGTRNPLGGAVEPGERVVLVEDVVTSGGAAADAVRAVRQAALECRTAI